MTEYIWLPHDTLSWIPAKVLENDGGISTYQTIDGETIEYTNDKLAPSSLERVSDVSLKVPGISNLTELDEFGEGAVVYQLRERYKQDLIYTNIGSILVVVNPYARLPLYGPAQIDSYRVAAEQGAIALSALSPHVYSIAAEAYTRLYEEDDSPHLKRSQAVIISGESGAGKTEATKTALQWLSEVAGSVTGVEQLILQSNPVLEAFGNARTLRNNNSSRFGKWMEIHFQPVQKGEMGRKIVSCRIINYLLEKSRVTTQSARERGYHVFYQLLAGLDPSLKSKFSLGQAEDYHYLNQGNCFTIDGVDEVEDFEATLKAMNALQFEPQRIESIWQLLAGILHLGQLKPRASAAKSDITEIGNRDVLELTTRILGLPSADVLSSALCYRSVTIRGSLSMIPLSVSEVETNRDALSKTIYTRLFDHLIEKMNNVLFKDGDKTPMGQKSDAQKKAGRSIGILDIFGFEIFDCNLFEQFCINYANESLQSHFNTHIFKLEQAEYAAEGIDVSEVKFVDNKECVELIQARPGMGQGGGFQGILAKMDEELQIPKGSDASLIEKMHIAYYTKGKEHRHYGMLPKAKENFIIKHYAGEVTYSSAGLLAKNKNTLNANLELLMTGGSSELKLLSEIFAQPGEEPSSSSATSPPARAKAGAASSTMSSPSNASKKKENTLAYQFSLQLQDLMATLHACNPHFVRCLKPNSEKQPKLFSTRMVLAQMSYAGLFEAIRIRKSGYPFRKALGEFGKRYRVCLSKAQIVEFSKKASSDPRSGVAFLLESLTPQHVQRNQYQLGKTKVFMKTQQRNLLDELRDKNLTKWAVQIQAFWRMIRAKKLLKRLKAFQKESIQVLEGDCTEKSLVALQQKARDQGLHQWAFILRRIQSTLTALNEIVRVTSLLDTSVSQNELPALEGALDQARKLRSAHPTIVPEQCSSSRITLVKTLGVREDLAVKARDHLLESLRLQQLLRDAVLEENLAALDSALAQAIKFGLDSHMPVMVQALKLQKQLREEETLMESLRQATKARDATLLEQLIAQVQQKRINLDSARTQDMSNACSTMHAVYSEKVRSLMNEAGEAQLKAALLPKVTSLAYNDLVSTITSYLAQATAEREARLAKERAGLAQAEREKLEAADRAKRAAEEEKARQAQAAEASAAAASMPRARHFSVGPPQGGDDGMPPPPPGDADMPPPPPPEDDSASSGRAPAISFAGPPVLAEHPLDAELDKAILKRNLPALEKAIANANALKHNSRLVRIAQNMAVNLQQEAKLRAELVIAINTVNVDACKRLIKACTAIGFLKDPRIEEARNISYGLSPADLLSLKMTKALPLGNVKALQEFLKEAADMKPMPLQNEVVEQVKDYLATQLSGGAVPTDISKFKDLDFNTTMRLNRTKQINPTTYANFIASKGQYPLSEVTFTPLRRAGNYAKGNYLSKSELKDTRLRWQTDSIPRSLVKLNTEYCGGSKDKSKQIKNQAKQAYKSIQGYMRDKYHSYPATLAYDVLMAGVTQPLIRDEIYCLLIKQTTQNPSTESLLYGLKLLYLCLSTFPPSAGLKLCLYSHLAQYALPTLPSDALGLQLPGDVASSAFIAYEHVQALTAAGFMPKPPSMADIEAITQGNLAKRSARFEDSIANEKKKSAASAAAASSSSTFAISHNDSDLPAPPPGK